MPAFQRYGFLLLLTAVFAGPSSGQSDRDHALPLPALSDVWIPADDTDAAHAALDAARRFVRADTAPPTAVRVRRLTTFGLWPEADSLLARAPADDNPLRLAEAELRFKQHRYADADRLVRRVLEDTPGHRAARLLQARLSIRAWTLPEAAETAEALLRNVQDPEAALVLGRVRLLERNYDDALKWAQAVQAWHPDEAEAYLLEADVRFWERDPAAAEPLLVRALELDPFNADARFGYGYAIWRRVDATQLDDMAAQWALALAVNPLHYETHWHWGNGHTHLTYADYARPSDAAVRARLSIADSLISEGHLQAALDTTYTVERSFPASPLPALTRGSAFYTAYTMDRAARLDSAQHAFETLLARKANYGPAHNGLAAVIKQRQFETLAAFDDLEAAIAATPLTDHPEFSDIFPDVRYYPGTRVEQMVRNQLHQAIVYLPLLKRLDRHFRIPPLHWDLAQTMNQPFFRYATTFDNRQWMDIRGVGSGAAGIEYVERGAHWERNVVLHEYVHLFHGQILTDAENRRIRQLYHVAMEEGRVLDYYSANNESEYLAQTYTAYFAPVKAHPLNHKSMNTRRDLETRDPALFGFIDSLVARQTAYLNGDDTALAGNWAQVYVTLSEQAREGEGPNGVDDETERHRIAAALLDTALTWASTYLPAFLSYAALTADAGRFDEAEDWLGRAQALDPDYAPIYQQRTAHMEAAYKAGTLTANDALELQVGQLTIAFELERDLAVRATLNRLLREAYAAHGRMYDAIRTAEAYAASAPVISTYLRDRRDEAEAFARSLRSRIGYAGGTLPFFRSLVSQKPQHYDLRAAYAEALHAAGRPRDAIATLEEAQQILAAAGRPRPDFATHLAGLHLTLGDTTAARAALAPVLEDTTEASYRLVRVLARLGDPGEAERRWAQMEPPVFPRDRADSLYTRGLLQETNDPPTATASYRQALLFNPYHLPARLRLIEALVRSGQRTEAEAVRTAVYTLPLPLGAEFQQKARGALHVER